MRPVRQQRLPCRRWGKPRARAQRRIESSSRPIATNDGWWAWRGQYARGVLPQRKPDDTLGSCGALVREPHPDGAEQLSVYSPRPASTASRSSCLSGALRRATVWLRSCCMGSCQRSLSTCGRPRCSLPLARQESEARHQVDGGRAADERGPTLSSAPTARISRGPSSSRSYSSFTSTLAPPRTA
jgi:hypothetical protein